MALEALAPLALALAELAPRIEEAVLLISRLP
jgi:hypothetical protein